MNKNLSKETILNISKIKNEPQWMTDFRLKSLDIYFEKKMPNWGADLSGFKENNIDYYISPAKNTQHSWDEVPENIKESFDILGIPEAEREMLAGVGAQYDSELIYKNLKAEWSEKGVIFTDISQALLDYPELVERYFAKVISNNDNKFAALNSAFWSGGSFVYVPPGVEISVPLQAYFQINSQTMGQFERTLIIADTNSKVHYIEGCSAPVYRQNSLHSAVVEIHALQGSYVRYTTIQNWSNNIYNLVTKRAKAYKNAHVEWVDGNFGSKVTMKYPCVVLQGENSSANVISVAMANEGQHQDSGAKIYHIGANSKSNIISKTISKNGGRSSYRGLVQSSKNSYKSKSSVKCDALLFSNSRTDTYPKIDIQSNCNIEHEASVTNVSKEHIFYAMSRGLREEKCNALVLNGFVGDFIEELPLEYALEINRLLKHEMEGSIG